MIATANPNRPTHAIVIGGSVAGMTTAQILTNHFGRVTIIERDNLPATPDFRKGVPHARHAHILLGRGQEVPATGVRLSLPRSNRFSDSKYHSLQRRVLDRILPGGAGRAKNHRHLVRRRT